MSHAPFIAASYALAVAMIAGYAGLAAVRLRAAGRRLRALDPRQAPRAGDGP